MHHADVAVARTSRRHERRAAVARAAGGDAHDSSGVLVVLGTRLRHGRSQIERIKCVHPRQGQRVVESDVDKQDRARAITTGREKQARLEAPEGHGGVGIDRGSRIGNRTGAGIDAGGDVHRDDERSRVRCQGRAPRGIVTQGASSADPEDAVDHEVRAREGALDPIARHEGAARRDEGLEATGVRVLPKEHGLDACSATHELRTGVESVTAVVAAADEQHDAGTTQAQA